MYISSFLAEDSGKYPLGVCAEKTVFEAGTISLSSNSLSIKDRDI